MSVKEGKKRVCVLLVCRIIAYQIMGSPHRIVFATLNNEDFKPPAFKKNSKSIHSKRFVRFFKIK